MAREKMMEQCSHPAELHTANGITLVTEQVLMQILSLKDDATALVGVDTWRSINRNALPGEGMEFRLGSRVRTYDDIANWRSCAASSHRKCALAGGTPACKPGQHSGSYGYGTSVDRGATLEAN